MSKTTILNYTRQTPTLFTDEQYTDVGTSFTLGNNKRAFLESGFQIRTAAGGGGTLLAEGVDYEWAELDSFYSQPGNEDANVWTKINILDSTYETGDLFVTYNAVLTYATKSAIIDIISASIPGHYARDTRWRAKSMSARTTLVSPARMTVNIDGSGYVLPAAVDINVSSAPSWDSTSPTNYTVAANRAGKDFYIYACVPSSGTAPDLVLSANATFPAGYSAATSRKIGGFHCLCVSVGTSVYAYVNEGKDPEYLDEAYETVSVSAGDTRHWLRDYVAGDILPFSLWDLLHRPATADTEGKVYHPGVNRWVDIYLASWDAGARKLRSVYGASFANSSVGFHHARFEQVFALQGQMLPSKAEFVALSLGGPQGVNISGSANPGTTGGHSATNGLRITSNIGCEDVAGVLRQWGREQSGNLRSSFEDAFDANDSNVAGQDSGDPARPHFGGNWNGGATCGSRGALWFHGSLAMLSVSGSRGVAEPCA